MTRAGEIVGIEVRRGQGTVLVSDASLAEEQPAFAGRREQLASEVAYSIRVPPAPGTVACPGCGKVFTASGPTGYADDEVICDLCLLESSPELGMVLALVSLTRAVGGLESTSRQERQEALVELGAFARIYERFAARSGPPRAFPIELPR